MAAARGIFRSASVISACTLLSRVLGLVRDVACASFFGDKWVFDAFSVAFRLPNLFRRLFGEGATSAAFIPVFTEYLETRPREDVWRLVGVSAAFLITALAAIVAVGELIFAGLHAWGGFGPRGLLTLELMALLLPYVLFICLVALCMAVLNSLDHFFSPAFAPVVLNVCWIAGVLWLAPRLGAQPQQQIFGLAIAILIGGVVQLAMQIPALRNRGASFRLCFDFAHPGFRRIIALMLPVIFGLAVMQLNVLLDSLIALGFSRPPGSAGAMSLLGWRVPYPMESGANSVLYYGDRLMQFPLGVLGIAMAAAALPAFSRLAARGDSEGLARAVEQTLRVLFFLAIPASVGLMTMRRPIVELLYQRGAFTPEAAARTARIVLCYAAGVWAYCGVHVLVRAFYALQDTRTPVRVAASLVAANLALNLTLIWFLREAGLALSTALCSAAQFVVLFVLLARRIGLCGMRGVTRCIVKTLAASALMAAACQATLIPLQHIQPLFLGKCLRVGVPIAAGGAVFLAASWALRSAELREVSSALAGKILRRGDSA